MPGLVFKFTANILIVEIGIRPPLFYLWSWLRKGILGNIDMNAHVQQVLILHIGNPMALLVELKDLWLPEKFLEVPNSSAQ